MKLADLLPGSKNGRSGRPTRTLRVEYDFTDLVGVLTRIADALDRAIPLENADLSPQEQEELDLQQKLSLHLSDEQIAALEIMEDQGVEIPAELYKKWGIEPSDNARSVDPLSYDETVFDRPQIDAEMNEESSIISTRKTIAGLDD